MGKIIGIVLGVIFMIVVALAGIANWRTSTMRTQIAEEAATLPAALKEAKQAGIYRTMQDLQKPLPPPEQNAAPLYVKLTALKKNKSNSPDSQQMVSLLKRFKWTPEEIKTVQATLDKHHLFLSLAHEASKRPKCVFKRDWDTPDPMAITFPEYATIRSAARVLSAESLLLAQRGRFREAVQNQGLCFQLARHAGSDGVLISHLVDLAVDSIAWNGLQQILYASDGDAKVAQMIEAEIARGAHPHDLSDALKSEVAFQGGVIAMMRRDGLRALGTATGDKDMQSMGKWVDAALRVEKKGMHSTLIDANHAYMLKKMKKIMESIDLPYPNAVQRMQEISREIDDTANKKNSTERMISLIGVIMVPEMPGLVKKEAQIKARERVLRAGVAAIAYRGAHGKLPERLSDAMLTAPTDPFDEKPLRYRKESGGFVVYSVGADGNYDGHIRPESEKKQGASDAVFRFPAPQ